MDTSRGLPTNRLAVGQLLGRLLHHFRLELFAAADDAHRFGDLRFSHLQIWGNVGIDGIRLTTLAEKSNLGLPACSELVDELQALGYLTRRRDPTDGRAKLIFPTAKGRRLLDAAGIAVADLEHRWRMSVEPGAFDAACRTLNDLLNHLERHEPDTEP
jgi:DNA-binding MarR family transcriptional regulator